jgi:hypothetical protein
MPELRRLVPAYIYIYIYKFASCSFLASNATIRSTS